MGRPRKSSKSRATRQIDTLGLIAANAASCQNPFRESAEYVLFKLPGLQGDSPIDLDADSRFDHIILHLALPSIACTKRDLESVARWSRQWVKQGGRFTIAAHNTVVTNDLVSYQPETHEFRTLLLAAARSRCVENIRRDPKRCVFLETM